MRGCAKRSRRQKLELMHRRVLRNECKVDFEVSVTGSLRVAF